ncbi:FDS protein [Hymenopellis radicata]|nr:FDS protein [Hymenopellis radicata]
MEDPSHSEAQVQSLPTEPLAYKYVVFENKMADDGGSGARTNMSSWRPNLESGWYYLGQGAESQTNRAPTGMIVHALEADALRDVSSWERVWDDAGSKKSRDFSLWRGVPPNDEYVVPDSVQTGGIKAIRRDLVVFDDTFQVWNDAGSKANKNGSVWKTWSRYGASPYALIPMLGHGAPSRDRSFSLDRSKTLEIKSFVRGPTTADDDAVREDVEDFGKD